MARIYTTIEKRAYKGHTIYRVEDDFRQEFYLVDKDFSAGHFSWADAKRAINGQQTIWLPVNLLIGGPVLAE